ncbi:FG-GAP-like repeat-containing protein [Thermoactinospora rubra]|uniref:FG-GAP-like repeat-containing protein n=1 Tax=Thermoactinospora rubra TaxID=1088767 RepID=UPI000A0FDFD5|nr:FG-GAP-like repeat-containing protein [Thermoactinospora rubra]
MRLRLFVRRVLAQTAAVLTAAGCGLVALSAATPAPAAASTTRERIVDIAFREYGNPARNREIGGEDCNFYTGQVQTSAPSCNGSSGFRVNAWCANFVKYVWKTAGVVEGLDLIDGYAYSLRDYGKAKGTWHPVGSGYSPRPGDAIVYAGATRPRHVGIVVSNSGGTIKTIEGNSGDRIALKTNPSGVEGYTSPVVSDVADSGSVNGDAFADIVSVTSDGALRYYGNNFNVSPTAPYGNGYQIGSGWQTMRHASLGDVNGDGYSDVLAVKPDGTLWYYGNNFNVSPRAPYGNGYQIGSGWDAMKHFTTGDVNGDGHADLLAVKPDGTLWYYGNNFNVSPRAPYGNGYQIGSGWDVMKHFAAGDVNGDGHADLLAVKPDGTLWYYGNNFNVSPTAPYGNGYQIGSGWDVMKHVTAGDVNGDGHADVLAVRPDGTLWYYGNNFNVSPRAPYGNGYQIGSGWDTMTHIL